MSHPTSQTIGVAESMKTDRIEEKTKYNHSPDLQTTMQTIGNNNKMFENSGAF